MLGFVVRARTSEGMKGTRIAFPEEVRSSADARRVLVAMVKKAVALIREQGPDKAYPEISDKAGPFVQGEFYIAVVGMPPEALQEPVVPYPAVPESQEAAAAQAVVDSPTVLIAGADIDVAEAELRGSRAGNYPRFDLELGAGANRNIDGVEGGGIDAQALLVARYNLFRGGADVAREREAFARVREARQALRQVQRDAAEEARVAYNALQTAQARVEALRAAVEAQRATRDVYAQQFDLGQRSLLDLLDAENELFIARSNLVTAQFTEIFGVYRVLAVTGELLMVLDIDRPKESISIWRERQEPVHERLPTIDRSPG